MWIQLPRIGFVSVVLARKAPGPGKPVDPDTVMIRARKRQHLDNLISACESLKSCKIIESAGTDYRFRVVAPKADFARALHDLALGIEWTNVKGEAEKHADQVGEDFCEALHETWAAFHRIQSRS